MSSKSAPIMTSEVHDVIIIGAGPCGLATAARLRERTPSAIFTDEEHDRYHWINRHGRKASIKSAKTGRVKTAGRDSDTDDVPIMNGPSILVLDDSGNQWMSKWKRLFSELQISHLRSPMFFHPDPHDRDGLLAYAHSHGRGLEDCIELANCVGKEVSKHHKKKKRSQRGMACAPLAIDERDRKDYFAPPSCLFEDYCSWLAQRYNLSDDLIQHGKVIEVTYEYLSSQTGERKGFTVKTANGGTYRALSVVLAVGAANRPTLPIPIPTCGKDFASHAFQRGDDALCERLKAKKLTRVLVVGGGLTSAQVVDRVVKAGATEVWLLIRGPMKVKPFDVDLNWMGKFRNHEKAVFWSADSDEERLDMIKSARGGGSITPRFVKVLQSHVAKGRVKILTHCSLTSVSYNSNGDAGIWAPNIVPEQPDTPLFHHIYFATGVQSDVAQLPYLTNIIEEKPIAIHEGLPALTDDLMWSADVPLFITGKLAALRLGPGAGNLEGARIGAERIAWALEDLLTSRPEQATGDTEKRRDSGFASHDDEMTDKDRYSLGFGSRFEALMHE